MPTYTYTCTACNHTVDKRQSFSDPPLTTCEECGGPVRKVIYPVGIVFKGSGWYVTDSRSSSSSANGSSSSSSSSSDGGASKDSGAKETSKDTSSSSSTDASSSSKSSSTPTSSSSPAGSSKTD
ncbi:MAG: FmdB family transcriptional regulator [Chloroflexi bacterium]|nr:FmdB family transcriptional regulator [Chloroflexota bacterium]